MDTKKTKIKSRYDEVDNEKIHFNDHSLTDPSFQEGTDINNIMIKYQNTGALPLINQQTPLYADVSNIGDYKESLDKIQAAQNAFMALPATVRERFQNDPGHYVDFMSDENNTSEAISLGLAIPNKYTINKEDQKTNDDLNNNKNTDPLNK
jgi:phage internal scaffolding protein